MKFGTDLIPLEATSNSLFSNFLRSVKVANMDDGRTCEVEATLAPFKEGP